MYMLRGPPFERHGSAVRDHFGESVELMGDSAAIMHELTTSPAFEDVKVVRQPTAGHLHTRYTEGISVIAALHVVEAVLEVQNWAFSGVQPLQSGSREHSAEWDCLLSSFRKHGLSCRSSRLCTQ